jgi:hypothetical protein
MQDDTIQGRRFIELLGQEGGQAWRLYEEKDLQSGEPVSLGD